MDIRELLWFLVSIKIQLHTTIKNTWESISHLKNEANNKLKSNTSNHHELRSFTLETQIGKPTSNGAQYFISTISGTMHSWLLCLFLSWPKAPLRMKFMREIGRIRG
jgi:hypothetical protein